jgi:signal transduction histidine kinase
MLTKKQRLIAAAALLFFALLVAGGPASARGAASREVRVGSELEFPPYAFIDERGRPAGFSVELIHAVADAMGLSITISTGPWDTVWNSLVAGRIDLLPIVAKLPERAHAVDFSLPHTETYDAFFVRKGDPFIKDIRGAKGKEIVVMRSDAAHHALLERNFPGRLILVDTIPEGLSLVASGKHDAFLCSKLIGTMAIERRRFTGLSAGRPIPDYKRVFSFAVKKGDAELLEKLNQGLLIVKTNGEYDRIYEKWLTADDPWRKLKKYLWPGIAVVVAVALIAGFWLVMLQLLVRKRTRELAEKNEMLRLAREELEERVELRTAELAQANAELQEANRELEAFTYSVSHDLRAPLRSVAGFSRLLEEDYGSRIDAQARDYLARIGAGTEKMGRLIEDLLNLSRVSRQDMERKEVDMSNIASALIRELRGCHAGRSVEACVRDGITAFADPRLMEVALSNLLGNAWKFTSKMENARIEFGAVDCGLRNADCGVKSETKEAAGSIKSAIRNPKSEIVYFVRDNGAGFDPKYAEKMFRPFQRLHSEQEFEGTGIGLAIVERIIRRHGGRVWAEGEAGKGATVYFTLG